MDVNLLSQKLEMLVDSGVIEPVADAMTRKVFDQWIATAPEDAAVRERLYAEARALTGFLGSVINMADAVKAARKEQK